MQKLLLLDLDGILVDLQRALLKLLKANHSYDEICYYEFFDTEYPHWRALTSTPEFWATLPKTPEFEELVTGIQNIVKHPSNLVICTHAVRVSGCTEGKYEWIARNLGKSFAKNVMVTNCKYAAAKGNVLVDDADHNVDNFRKWGGKACLFPRPWNRRHHDRRIPPESRFSSFVPRYTDVPKFLAEVEKAWVS